MRLTRVVIAGYRSIREPLELVIDPRVSVLLGANDHGKSNILHALLHLNEDHPFDEEDLNWDLVDKADEYPKVDYYFELDEDDRAELVEFAKAKLAEEVAAAAPPATSKTADAASLPDPAAPPPSVSLSDVPLELHLWRTGVGEDRKTTTPNGLPKGAATELIAERLPRVELITPFDSLPDRVTYAELSTAPFEFMQGVFFYAGIDEEEWDSIFEQSPRTTHRLKDANTKLNETLRDSWGQGSELSFSLIHDSALKAIELQIEDPAVHNRFVHASQRSNGFTHFFALKTVLHARQMRADATSYIWLFDEPGIYLHPAGQRDLLQAIEAIATGNQVLYSTHSIFLVNKNFPARHRLVHKDAEGTRLDVKPYASRWNPALEALGLSLPGTILFASHILITEGDSEPVALYAVLQKGVESGSIEGDLNPLAIIGSGDARNADILIRVLMEAQPQPRIAVLLDGDKRGSDRLGVLRKTLDARGIPFHQLAKDTTIEDHLPLASELYVDAVAAWVQKLREDHGLPDSPKVRDDLHKSFKNQFSKPSESKGIAEWARSEGQRIGGLPSPPSSVGIAREYGTLLASRDPSDLAKLSRRPATLVRWVLDTLRLPNRVASEDAILEDLTAPD